MICLSLNESQRYDHHAHQSVRHKVCRMIECERGRFADCTKRPGFLVNTLEEPRRRLFLRNILRKRTSPAEIHYTRRIDGDPDYRGLLDSEELLQSRNATRGISLIRERPKLRSGTGEIGEFRGLSSQFSHNLPSSSSSFSSSSRETEEEKQVLPRGCSKRDEDRGIGRRREEDLENSSCNGRRVSGFPREPGRASRESRDERRRDRDKNGGIGIQVLDR